jgi:hypothetical protein
VENDAVVAEEKMGLLPGNETYSNHPIDAAGGDESFRRAECDGAYLPSVRSHGLVRAAIESEANELRGLNALVVIARYSYAPGPVTAYSELKARLGREKPARTIFQAAAKQSLSADADQESVRVEELNPFHDLLARPGIRKTDGSGQDPGFEIHHLRGTLPGTASIGDRGYDTASFR